MRSLEQDHPTISHTSITASETAHLEPSIIVHAVKGEQCPYYCISNPSRHETTGPSRQSSHAVVPSALQRSDGTKLD